ncbi:cytochrome b-c1 complex subunit 8 [Octopus sinensis]|nr:cytochrome b-c1 complex subunit 8 [Octopus sinensis]XP_036360851.1 cytochrome b-c1 complex subunit 8 [Octopus sinensis]
MGKMFGNLHHISGVITYSLSPFEQKAFAGAISHGVPNMWNRFKGQAFRVLPPLIFCYLVYDYGEKLHSDSLKKNPKDFENDE